MEGASKNEFYREAATRSYQDQSGKRIKLSTATIQRWYYYYEKKGFNGLKPQKRKDKGCFRKLDADIMAQIDFLKAEYPRIQATLIYEKLLQNGTTKRTLFDYQSSFSFIL